MKIRYIISFAALIALTGVSCWGAAYDPNKALLDAALHYGNFGDRAITNALNSGADINAQTSGYGYTALMYLAQEMDRTAPAVIANLLARGARVSIRDRISRTALDRARSALPRNDADRQIKDQIIQMLEAAMQREEIAPASMAPAAAPMPRPAPIEETPAPRYTPPIETAPPSYTPMEIAPRYMRFNIDQWVKITLVDGVRFGKIEGYNEGTGIYTISIGDETRNFAEDQITAI